MSFSNQASADPSLPSEVSPGSTEGPDTSLFVVPEIPLGPIGAISATAIACGLFALKKQKL
jgi:hypothetical protein